MNEEFTLGTSQPGVCLSLYSFPYGSFVFSLYLFWQEAGGVVSGFDGKFPIDICNRQVVATNSKLLPKIVSLITKH